MTVNHIDKADNKVLETEEVSGNVGEKLSVKSKEIEGYTVEGIHQKDFELIEEMDKNKIEFFYIKDEPEVGSDEVEEEPKKTATKKAAAKK